MSKIKVLSLFDGISCARVALERLGYEVEYYASEIDKYAIQVAMKNYPDTVQVGDVSELQIQDIKVFRLDNGDYVDAWDFDLLIGGSPCQDLSIAKKDRKGLAGARSGLFYEYVRILKEVKPKYFILENVASMPKEAKEQISEILGVQPIMINAALVSAQNRKRLFWTNIPGVTQPEDRGIMLKDVLEDNPDIKPVTSTNWRIKRNTVDVNGKSRCLNASNFKGAQNDGMSLVPVNTQGAEKTIRTSGRGSGLGDKHNWDTIRIGQIGNGGQGDRIYSPEGKSGNLSANGGGRGAKTGLYETDTVIRKLSCIECERLQSLPDNYTEGISNSQRYKALGNAFNVEVVRHILSFIPNHNA